ncbi:hypothetical protein TRFO_09196 [Tritrichomonas foetus]|uniref:Glycosyltransferase RgtA/B/C/D-like domain-containing protein n=1 Tax=Tritrichomonas foetus TaxID=1144522 RepID=A0A1J4JGI9_9EUKA|nr:hypothetical protein TRFO_09196 [Tritrichomonas foetus]|eukprot:OHS97785.1 hypothetical protein TRFO_09196 [Tritrichomonas foetus]
MIYLKKLKFYISQRPLFQKLLNPFQTYFLSFYRSLFPITNLPNDFWKIGIDDLKCFFAMTFTTVSLWIATAQTGNPNSVIAYWDGPNYIYAAITLYDISHSNPWTKYFNYPPSYFACHLPGYPLLIRFFAFFTIGNFYIASYITILFTGYLLCYSFRRLLIVYDCVSNPTYTTMLLSIIPMRLFIYHSIIASEPLYLSCVYMCFIFYKIENFPLMMIFIWYACITRIEGMLIGATIGFCYLLRFEIVKALSMFSTFLSTIGLLILHRAMFGDAMAYIKFNSGHQGLVGKKLFVELIYGRSSTHDVLYLHSFIDFYFPYVIGICVVVIVAGPLGIFGAAYLLYVALLRHIDLFRYSLPSAVFAILIGYDKLWSDKISKSMIYFFAPIYFAFLLSYSTGQIHSNRSSDKFLMEVINANLDKLH